MIYFHSDSSHIKDSLQIKYNTQSIQCLLHTHQVKQLATKIPIWNHRHF